MPLGPLGDQSDKIERDDKRQADRRQRHQHQARRAVDEQQNGDDQRDSRILGILDALLHRIEHVRADRRGAGNAELQSGGKARLVANFVDLGIDAPDERHVVDRHQFRIQLEIDEHGLAAFWIVTADQLPPDDVVLLVTQHGNDGRFFAFLRREHRGQPRADFLIVVAQASVGPRDDQHDAALRGQIGERLFHQLLAADAGHRGRKVGEVAVVGDIVPLRCGELESYRQDDPGNQHPNPVLRDASRKFDKHAV